MKLFSCSACGHTLYFDNVCCTHCGHALGFVAERLELLAFTVDNGGIWHAVGDMGGAGYRPCANYSQHDACNWMVPAQAPESLCLACDLNRTIPDLSNPHYKTLWQRLQVERNRLVYSLLRLGLPVRSKQADPEGGLAFDFLAQPDPRFHEDSRVVTGHAQGVITLDVAEADDAVRERVRQDMAEPYRTVLGHFRHESAHYYWDRLVRGSAWLADFRACFGDERADYGEALERHYQNGPPTDWPARFVSAYASCHPWEDWAESFAHYLHMVDTLETAWQFGLRLQPRTEKPAELSVDGDFDPYASPDINALIQHWLPFTVALNSLNQSMGLPDAYPFVLSTPVLEKLGLVHRIIHESAPLQAPLP